jgi:ADP-heptose:LPS heptosyltransferase
MDWGIEPDQPLFCIHPGTGTWVKHWQEKSWATVADTLVEQLNAAVVFTGGDHELQLVQRITTQMRQPYCIIGRAVRASASGHWARQRAAAPGCGSRDTHGVPLWPSRSG